LASSLGLNRIKTRSGPLPQESFFGFRGDKGGATAAVLGASNLSRPGVGKKKEVGNQNRVGFREGLVIGGSVDNGSSLDSLSSGSGVHSMDQSPVVLPRSRLQNGESSSETGIIIANMCLNLFFPLFFVMDGDGSVVVLCCVIIMAYCMCLLSCERELWIYI
jgi:hypothetical protein